MDIAEINQMINLHEKVKKSDRVKVWGGVCIGNKFLMGKEVEISPISSDVTVADVCLRAVKRARLLDKADSLAVGGKWRILHMWCNGNGIFP